MYVKKFRFDVYLLFEITVKPHEERTLLRYKINIQLIISSLISIILCTCITAWAFYDALQHEAFIDLSVYAKMLADIDPQSDLRLNIPEDIRVTLIDVNGNAFFDSRADVTSLENHNERPEVIQAFEEGEGYATRRSSTLSKTAYYYAIRLDSGNVIRVSREGNSLTSVVMNILPMLAVLLLILIGTFIGFSRFMADSILQPINRIADNTDNVSEDDVYPELRPFVRTIRSQREEIMRDANMRQEFTANVSHELKTPLTAISGYAELMENEMIPVDQYPAYAKQIHKNSDRLLTLINDVIRLSELDSVKREVCEPVNLTEIASQCLALLEFKAAEQNVSLHLDTFKDTDLFGDIQSRSGNEKEAEPIMTVGDPQMYEELIYNLCDNAVRYNNPGGHVYVTLREEPDEIIIGVRDTGIGIPRVDQDRIFERFYRVSKSRSKQTGGTGLGLAIVKHIVEQIGAGIELESETGMGTDIRVRCQKTQESQKT